MALTKLLGLCLTMFTAAFACGEIPLHLSIGQRNMKYISTFGVGLLIGVSFIVIIPEGVHTYYGAKPTAVLAANSTFAAGSHALVHDHSHEENNYGRLNAHLGDEEHYLETDPTKPGSTLSPHTHDHASGGHSHEAEDDHDHEHDHDHAEGGHSHSHESCVDIGRSSANVGFALVAGFVLMFIVDRLGGGEEGHAHSHGGESPVAQQQNHPYREINNNGHIHVHPQQMSVLPASSSSSSLSESLPATPSGGSAAGNHEHARRGDHHSHDHPHMQHSHSHSHAEPSHVDAVNHPHSPAHDDAPLPAAKFDQTATIGILVHSAIDGLALGAISVSDNSSLELVVFMAIVIHKAPAAFGLSSFLMHQGRSKSEVRRHLLYFSLAAPLTSLTTYLAFAYYNSLAGSNSLSANSPDGQALLGLCLLFSAGTFLFTIAVHILPEIQSNSPSAPGRKQPAEWWMLTSLISGMLSPLMFPNNHSHGGH